MQPHPCPSEWVWSHRVGHAEVDVESESSQEQQFVASHAVLELPVDLPYLQQRTTAVETPGGDEGGTNIYRETGGKRMLA